MRGCGKIGVLDQAFSGSRKGRERHRSLPLRRKCPAKSLRVTAMLTVQNLENDIIERKRRRTHVLKDARAAGENNPGLASFGFDAR